MTFVPRYYQEAATQKGIEHLTRGQGNGVIVIPTGGGKSAVISAIASNMDGRTLVLQPSKEILEQNYQKTFACGQTDIGIYSASFGSKKVSKITFATIGSIVKKPEIFADFDRILMDECHLANPKEGMYQRFFLETESKVLGLTASPYRLHGATTMRGPTIKFINRTNPRIFSNLLHITQNKELFDAGYLCPIWYMTEGYDTRQLVLKSSGVEYTDESIASYNRSIGMVGKIAHYCMGSEARHILTFCANMAEAREVAEKCEAYGTTTRLVSAETPDDERSAILSAFKSGRIRHVVNVGVLTTGFDFPALDCVIGARPTNSVSLYYQMVGRGIRISPDTGKEYCRYVDLVGNVKKFGKVEEFEIVGHLEKKHRLKSSVGFLTGVDMVSGADLEQPALEGQVIKPNTSTMPTYQKWMVGKHKGERIDKVPAHYLSWVKENFNDGPHKRMAVDELDRRARREAAHV